ncbi:hypothetical protein [Streptomyces sp. NPDC054765]
MPARRRALVPQAGDLLPGELDGALHEPVQQGELVLGAVGEHRPPPLAPLGPELHEIPHRLRDRRHQNPAAVGLVPVPDHIAGLLHTVDQPGRHVEPLSADLAAMFRHFTEAGLDVNMETLRHTFPETGRQRFHTWASEHSRPVN